ncbi:MAG: hypothetical protein LBJ23_06595 [Tannerella sp.]|nr:hypothetical protein [Tannerella sp.]
MTKALYTCQLQKQESITFNPDYATSGTGCTARSILPAYRVYPQAFDREITVTLHY